MCGIYRCITCVEYLGYYMCEIYSCITCVEYLGYYMCGIYSCITCVEDVTVCDVAMGFIGDILLLIV